MVMSIAGIVFSKERWMISDFLILASDGRFSPLAVDVFLHRFVGFLGTSGGRGLGLFGIGFMMGMIAVSVIAVSEEVVVIALVDCFSNMSTGIAAKASGTFFGDFGISDFKSSKRRNKYVS